MTGSGLVYGLLAFFSWGFAPVYFKALGHVPAMHVLGHRALWSSVFLAIVLTARGRWSAVRTVLTVRNMALLVVTACLMGLNWFLFIWAVTDGRVLDTSLGYFISPLVTVLLGVLVLRERLTPGQALALVLAAVGVLIPVVRAGVLPWVSLALAASFGSYSLLRKLLGLDALAALALETLVLTPPALFYLSQHDAVWVADGRTQGLLMLAGVVTALPLLWFAEAARRLPLSVLGVLQYVSPSCSFLLAVLIYHEPFDHVRMVSFAFIWCAIVVFMLATRRTAAPLEAR